MFGRKLSLFCRKISAVHRFFFRVWQGSGNFQKHFESKTTMKAIFLISSIFYLLGLKLGNNAEWLKKAAPADTVVIKQALPVQKIEKAVQFNSVSTKVKTENNDKDTTQNSGSSKIVAPADNQEVKTF